MTTTTNKNHYDSCGMYHPDGTLMVRTSFRRANWYIQRNLAEWMDDTHQDFRLFFEPNGHGQHDDAFYTQKMDDHCVVCGTTEELTKHHVVPYQFRRILPVHYKGRNHHDILLVCWTCHERYEREADKLKEVILHDYGFSKPFEISPEEQHNRRVQSAKHIIEELENGTLKSRNGVQAKIPKDRLLTLQKTANLPEMVVPEAWQPKFLKKMENEKALHDFFIMWRNHFVDTMKPQYLPKYWQVEHRLENSLR